MLRYKSERDLLRHASYVSRSGVLLLLEWSMNILLLGVHTTESIWCHAKHLAVRLGASQGCLTWHTLRYMGRCFPQPSCVLRRLLTENECFSRLSDLLNSDDFVSTQQAPQVADSAKVAMACLHRAQEARTG